MIQSSNFLEFSVGNDHGIANFNSDEDYEQNIKPYIDMWFGISAEELSRKSKLPLLVARSKLEVCIFGS